MLNYEFRLVLALNLFASIKDHLENKLKDMNYSDYLLAYDIAEKYAQGDTDDFNCIMRELVETYKIK